MKNHTKITPKKQGIVQKFMALDPIARELVMTTLKAYTSHDIEALTAIRDAQDSQEFRDAIDAIIDCLQVKGGAK